MNKKILLLTLLFLIIVTIAGLSYGILSYLPSSGSLTERLNLLNSYQEILAEQESILQQIKQIEPLTSELKGKIVRAADDQAAQQQLLNLLRSSIPDNPNTVLLNHFFLKSEELSQGYRSIEIRMEWLCPWEDLITFLYHLENDIPGLQIDQLCLENNFPQGIKTSLVVRMLYFSVI